jgi:hypothetical protein
MRALCGVGAAEKWPKIWGPKGAVGNSEGNGAVGDRYIPISTRVSGHDVNDALPRIQKALDF